MRIRLLGTGTPTPSLKRMCSGYVIEIGRDVAADQGGREDRQTQRTRLRRERDAPRRGEHLREGPVHLYVRVGVEHDDEGGQTGDDDADQAEGHGLADAGENERHRSGNDDRREDLPVRGAVGARGSEQVAVRCLDGDFFADEAAQQLPEVRTRLSDAREKLAADAGLADATGSGSRSRTWTSSSTPSRPV